MIYLDYQATTPLAPEVFEAMVPWLRDHFANPHSASRPGRAAKAAIEAARGEVAALLPHGGRVVFTSGATEALNWAIKGTVGAITTLATEHAAVLDTVRAEGEARAVRIASTGRDGVYDPEASDREAREPPPVTPGLSRGPPRRERQPLENVARWMPEQVRHDEEGGLTAIMLVNNEIGVVQPIQTIPAGGLRLCDAVQGYGRVPIPDTCDMIAISAHKIHGPKGIGALWIRDGITLAPLLHGGDQEDGRSGTLSPALCVGFGTAARLMADRANKDAAHVDRLWGIATDRLAGWTINGSVEHRYRGNLNVRRDGLDVNRLMSDCRDIAFSAGSACASGSGRTSHVLKAIGLTDAQARSSIRLGFGRYTSETELGAALDTLVAAADAQRVAA